MPDIDFALLPESYEKLSVENVQANKQLLRDLWKSAASDLDLDHGALDTLVLNPAATLLETARETFRTARKSSSFAALAANSSDGVSEKMLDELAVSYRVQRRKGTAASGRIRLFFQEDVYRVVGLSTIFAANGILFNVRNVETLQLSGDLPSTLPHYQNLKETQDGSGLFYADLTVYARTASAAGNLVQGTELTLYQSSLPYFVRAVALETFTGGDNDEGTDSLVRRMILGVSAKVLSSRVNMKAALLEQFPDIRDSAVIGAGDLEMTRDKHSVFPGSTGGFCDWYVGTTRQLARTSVVVDVLSENEAGPGGLFRYTVHIDDALISCLYHVTAVQDEESLEYGAILSQSIFTKEQAETEDAPQIHEHVEGAFSAYQVTEIRFAAAKPCKKVRVYGIQMPRIRAIQDWVLQGSQAPVGLDILVKGAIPAVVRFGAILHTPETVEPVVLQSVVADFVNHIPLGGLLAVSQLTTLLHQHLPSGSYVTRPALFATAYLPDGRVVISQSDDRLEIDHPPFASNRTTMFFCDPADVSFELRYSERG
ncbi:MAG TPA: hypothetical protein DEB39_07980 [Planctomycetaceae bacterium]|nr:hypothetical protein [Planctomycetaceae bacterium]